jgi:hypothetical protein
MPLSVHSKIQFLRLLVAVALAGFMLACGGGSGSQENTAASAVTFQVVWDRTEMQPADFQRAGLSDCDDVDTVTAAVYTRDNQLLGEGGPWSCGNGSGVIDRLPAYRYAIISVEGRGAEGLPLYRGQSTRPFYLVPGRVDGGLIVASSLVPSLLSPADLGVVNPNALELQWTPVKAATGYQVMIATSATFVPAAVIDVPGGAGTSLRPDMVLYEDTTYYWRVQALAEGDSPGAPSAVRRFRLDSSAVLTVTISSPNNASIFRPGEPILFAAQVSDQLGAALTADDLSVVAWSSSIDGAIGDALAFEDDGLSEGSHTISLSVVSRYGLTGNDNVYLAIHENPPPVVVILQPSLGETFDYTEIIGDGITCRGSATDAEGGTLTGDALQWSMVNQICSGTAPIWTASGEMVLIDPEFLQPCPESGFAPHFEITLKAIDHNGTEGVQSVAVTVIHQP